MPRLDLHQRLQEFRVEQYGRPEETQEVASQPDHLGPIGDDDTGFDKSLDGLAG